MENIRNTFMGTKANTTNFFKGEKDLNTTEYFENNYFETEDEQEEITTVNYNKLSAWGKFKYRAEQVLDVIRVIRCIACFTSICSTVAFYFMVTNGPLALVGFFGLIGMVSALLACPFKLIGIAISLILGGFSIGLCFLGFGCIIGAGIGMILGVMLAIFFPAFVAIPYFFNDLRYR